MEQTLLPNIKPSLNYKLNPLDVVFTPDKVAKKIIEIYKPAGKCLDPCRGEGSFFKFLPPGSDWCEIKEGRDFFEYSKKVDWIVSNPPYSIWDKWMEHSFKIADNIVYLLSWNKVWSSWGRLKRIRKYGGIKKVVVFNASQVGFPFGFPLGAYYFKRLYKGVIEIDFVDDI